MSEKIRKIAIEFGLLNAFHFRHTLGKLFIFTKPAGPVFDTENITYSIPCECGGEHVGESCRHFQVHVNEHRVNVQRALLWLSM